MNTITAAMEETNIRPTKKPKGERQVGNRAEKLPLAMAEFEVVGLRHTSKQAVKAGYCLKDYKGRYTQNMPT